MRTIIAPAQPYVYSGEWVATCPRPDCGNVEHLFTSPARGLPRVLRKPFFSCSYCALGMAGDVPVDWPDPALMDQITSVLMRRPIPHTRNWYPKDHPTAVAFRIPHGQSVADLLTENAEHGVE